MKHQLSIFQNSLLLLFLSLISCSDNPTSNTPEEYNYSQPTMINDGWETAELTSVGMDEEKLGELIDYINFGLIKNIHSVLIVKDGKLVFEEYFAGHEYNYNSPNYLGNQVDYDKETPHHLASVTKSFTSALIGIAIDKNLIKSINEKVFSYLPEYSEYNTGEKQNITVKHLLTMSAGFQWNEHDVDYGNKSNDLIQMWMANDPLEYLVTKPLIHTPGTQFYYNSGCTNLLGEVLHKASGLKPDVFADMYLFDKLGFKTREWESFPNGVIYTSGDLKIVPRDMAKFGYLYLKEGMWKNNQVLSKDWIIESVNPSIEVDNTWQYGFLWWSRNYKLAKGDVWSYSALGWGGQQITIIPDLKLVIVFTGGNFATGNPVNQLIADYILPSIIY